MLVDPPLRGRNYFVLEVGINYFQVMNVRFESALDVFLDVFCFGLFCCRRFQESGLSPVSNRLRFVKGYSSVLCQR